MLQLPKPDDCRHRRPGNGELDAKANVPSWSNLILLPSFVRFGACVSIAQVPLGAIPPSTWAFVLELLHPNPLIRGAARLADIKKMRIGPYGEFSAERLGKAARIIDKHRVATHAPCSVRHTPAGAMPSR